MENRAVRYALIFLGCLISSASINLFLVPHHLLSGGVSGIAIVFYYLFSLPIGVQILVMNIPLLLMAWRLLGRDYTCDVVLGTVAFAVLIDIMKPLSAYHILNDSLLAAIYGGLFNGIGFGIIFRANGSSGGLDIIAAIIKKYYSLNMGAVIFSLNCLIMVIAAFLFDIERAMMTLVSMYVSSLLTDKVVAGFNNKKSIIIISDKTAEISDEIIKAVGRGVTFLKGEGAFTHEDKEVIFVVVSLTQIGKLKLIVSRIDPLAFMIVQNASEVMGRGFTLPLTMQKMVSDKEQKN